VETQLQVDCDGGVIDESDCFRSWVSLDGSRPEIDLIILYSQVGQDWSRLNGNFNVLRTSHHDHCASVDSASLQTRNFEHYFCHFFGSDASTLRRWRNDAFILFGDIDLEDSWHFR
jgi:hypothetical protein